MQSAQGEAEKYDTALCAMKRFGRLHDGYDTPFRK